MDQELRAHPIGTLLDSGGIHVSIWPQEGGNGIGIRTRRWDPKNQNYEELGPASFPQYRVISMDGPSRPLTTKDVIDDIWEQVHHFAWKRWCEAYIRRLRESQKKRRFN